MENASVSNTQMVGLFLYFRVLSNQSDDDDDVKGKSSVYSEGRQFIHISFFYNNSFSQKYCDVFSYSLFAGHLGRKWTLFDTSVAMRLLRRVEVKNSSASHF